MSNYNCSSEPASCAPTEQVCTLGLVIQIFDDLYHVSHVWENLFMPYANNKGADQPAHPRSQISAFLVRCLDSIIPLVSIAEILSLYLAAVAEEAGLSFYLVTNPKDRFSRDVAHIGIEIIIPHSCQ